ncbi:uncharacterized protein LOC125239395 isoform X1 [Leguminivora glycinivorella]|uniref:uncharacterized protein LOC125239395 isoform X1 n=1 Tax=Leguminivora glycinivorella TaxID=1035111 RepID=UPI00200CC872|nr:uncharacterized protein LOC125239395 isoform X1 [Leguminivora glycinivorella]
MKYCGVLLLLGIVALDASVIQPSNESVANGLISQDRPDGVYIRNRVDSEQDRVTSERDAARNLRRSDDGTDANKVLAFGLDTGVADTKNSIVQAISEAFGGLVQSQSQSQHARSNTGEKKKPLALELRSDSILRAVENFLASPRVKRLTRDLAKKAAIIYRAIEKEL